MANGGLLQLNAKNYICFRGLALERLLSCCPTAQVQLHPHPLHAFHVWATFRGERLLALLKEVEINALFEPMHYSKCSGLCNYLCNYGEEEYRRSALQSTSEEKLLGPKLV